MDLFPFLGTGKTWADFQDDGKIPDVYDKEQSFYKIGASSAAQCFKIIAGILSGPGDLFIFNR